MNISEDSYHHHRNSDFMTSSKYMNTLGEITETSYSSTLNSTHLNQGNGIISNGMSIGEMGIEESLPETTSNIKQEKIENPLYSKENVDTKKEDTKFNQVRSFLTKYRLSFLLFSFVLVLDGTKRFTAV